MNILYSHRLDKDNPGDLWSTPKHYFFDDIKCDVVDVFKDNNFTKTYDSYITGGGDILVSDKWLTFNKRILDKIKTKVNIVWGAGVNFDHLGIKEYLKSFNLIGTRTFKKEYSDIRYSFVPCSSVMNTIFDKEVKEDKQVSLIHHFKRPLDINLPYLSIKNKPNNLEEVVNTIATSKTIITNSYHAAYWSMILNKRTIVMIEHPNCKLSTFKYKPFSYQKGNFDVTLLEEDYNYKHVKEEFRDLNLDFYKKVKDEYKSYNNV